MNTYIIPLILWLVKWKKNEECKKCHKISLSDHLPVTIKEHSCFEFKGFNFFKFMQSQYCVYV